MNQAKLRLPTITTSPKPTQRRHRDAPLPPRPVTAVCVPGNFSGFVFPLPDVVGENGDFSPGCTLEQPGDTEPTTWCLGRGAAGAPQFKFFLQVLSLSVAKSHQVRSYVRRLCHPLRSFEALSSCRSSPSLGASRILGRMPFSSAFCKFSCTAFPWAPRRQALGSRSCLWAGGLRLPPEALGGSLCP